MQRIVGVILGALVTYAVLLVMDATKGDATPKYGLAVAIGAVVSLLWPWVIAFILGRRAKARHTQEVDREIDHKLAEERAKRG